VINRAVQPVFSLLLCLAFLLTSGPARAEEKPDLAQKAEAGAAVGATSDEKSSGVIPLEQPEVPSEAPPDAASETASEAASETASETASERASETTSNTASEEQRVLQEVERLVSTGDEAQARRTLQSWLLAHPSHGGFPHVLEKYFELEAEIPRLEQFLAELLKHMGAGPHAALAWEKRANLAELSGNIHSAEEFYVRAAEASSGDRRAVYLMESARLLFEEGYLQRAQNTVAAVFLLTENSTILGLAGILQANIAMDLGRSEEAGRILRALVEDPSMTGVRPQVLLALFLLYQDDNDEAAAYLAALEKEYADSPEYALALRAAGSPAEVTYLFSPRRYLDLFAHELEGEADDRSGEERGGGEDEADGKDEAAGKDEADGSRENKPEEGRLSSTETDGVATGGNETASAAAGTENAEDKEAPEPDGAGTEEGGPKKDDPEGEEGRDLYMIQTGSFIDRENAEYMVSDLEEIGFSALIRLFERDGIVYHRVVIPDIVGWDEARKILRRIKDAGFDGFITTSSS
jgi:cell division septation protein DedD